jgi:hypothetical protein
MARRRFYYTGPACACGVLFFVGHPEGTIWGTYIVYYTQPIVLRKVAEDRGDHMFSDIMGYPCGVAHGVRARCGSADGSGLRKKTLSAG